jgi:hypothetical protein
MSSLFIVRYLHDEHEMNAHGAEYVCLSVRLSTCPNSRIAGRILINSDYGIYALRLYPKTAIVDFLQLVITMLRPQELVRWEVR